MPLEPLDQARCLGGRERFIERRRLVRAEIVLHQHDLTRVGEVAIRQILEDLRIIERGMAVGYLDMAPSLQRSEPHEQVDRAVALVFVVVPGGLARLCRDRRAGFLDKLFVVWSRPTTGWPGLMQPVVNLQDVLHQTTKAASASSGMTHCFWRCGLRMFF